MKDDIKAGLSPPFAHSFSGSNRRKHCFSEAIMSIFSRKKSLKITTISAVTDHWKISYLKFNRNLLNCIHHECSFLREEFSTILLGVLIACVAGLASGLPLFKKMLVIPADPAPAGMAGGRVV
jgi:hypothetical protein